MNQLFISYAKEDRASAKMLYSDLTKLGFDTWLDTISLVGGQNWELEIKKAIENSLFFIALLSGNSISKKGYVQKELKEALKIMELLPENEIYIIPVRLDNIEPSYDKLRQIHWIDIFEDWNLGVKEIVRAINLQRPDIRKNIHTGLEIIELNLNDVVRWALRILAPSSAEKKLEIISRLSVTDLIVKAELQQIRQAVMNVIMNAIQYSYVFEDNNQSWIEIKTTKTEDYAVITVENCGTPITDEEINDNLCFSPFYIGKYATKEGHSGTGLGLPLAQRIISNNKGEVTIKSLPASNRIISSKHIQPYITTVTIKLPIAK